MFKAIDYLLDRLTMYRLMLYYLLVLIAAAIVFSQLGIMHYNPVHIAFSAAYIFVICWLTNKIFAWGYDVPTGRESTWLTALILALIITPYRNPHDLLFFTAAAGLAISSKYILAWRGRHIFNPVAVGVALTALGAHQTASWWVGAPAMAPLVLLGGLLVVRKLRSVAMVSGFLVSALVVTIIFNMSQGHLGLGLSKTLLQSALLFLAFVMLTEPRTSPATKNHQIAYGVLVGLLFPPQVHLGSLYSTPELALLVGNVYAFFSSSPNLLLRLKKTEIITPDVLDFVFVLGRPLKYRAGQYMEWTLPHGQPDSRGNRRYFTLASSPTEPNLRIGVKFYDQSSTFKQAMLGLDGDTLLAAGSLRGDFVLPSDDSQKLAFIAGGIGITPFRSMLKFLVDKRQSRDITLLYSERSTRHFAYRDILKEARHKLGIKTVYAITDSTAVPRDWPGQTGRISAAMIKKTVPDFADRTFYIAGSQPMVQNVQNILLELGVSRRQIKTDFFPGYA